MRWIDAVLDERVTSRAAGIARILVGVGALLKGIQVTAVITRFEVAGTLHVPYADWAPSVSDLPAAVTGGVWMAAAALFTLGAFTSVSGAVLTAVIAFVLLSDQQLYSNHLYLLVLLTGLLTLARAGSALSTDAVRGRGRETIPGWPLFLLKVQISIVYLFAGLSKINATFLSGTVVAVTLRPEGPFAIPFAWRTFEVMATFSILAVLTELFLAAALWLPRWRRAAFVVGLFLHLGIAVWFVPTDQLLVFSIIILAPYVLFLRAPAREATVVWDGSCSFCAGWIQLFRRLDWLHAVRFVPSSDAAELLALGVPRGDADRALQLVRGSRREQGFRAVLGVLELVPVSFLWAPLLRLPPVAWLGDVVYRRVAARRRCSVAERPLARHADERA